MNELPELVRAGTDDWLFILFVLFGIAAQAIDANRKKKQAERRKGTGPQTRPPAAPADAVRDEPARQEFDAFWQALGVEKPVVPTPPETEPAAPSPAPPPQPMQPVSAPPKPVPELVVAKRALSPSDGQASAAPVTEMEENVIQMLQHSRTLVMDMQNIQMPTIPVGPRLSAGMKHRATFDLNLKDRNELRRAILNQEILGKPKAMELY